MKHDDQVLEHQLREEQLDYVLVYSEKDEVAAEDIVKRLKISGLEGRLYNDPNPFKSWHIESEIEKMTDLVRRSTFKFFLASNNLVDESEESEFIHHKSEALMESINYRDQTVIPIWLVPKRDIDRSSSRVLYGLMSLQGLNPNSKYFDANVTKLHNMGLFQEKKTERARLQNEELEKFLKLKKPRRVEAPTRENGRLTHDFEDRRIGHGGSRGNHYHVTVHNAGSVTIGGNITEAQQNHVDDSPSFVVSDSFWSRFNGEGATGGAPGLHRGHHHQDDVELMEYDVEQPSQPQSEYSHDAPDSHLDSSTTDISTACSSD